MEPGVCTVCECTEQNPCDGGCGWTDDTRTLCDACALADGFARVVLAARAQFEAIAAEQPTLAGPGRWRQVLAMTTRAFLERYEAQRYEARGERALIVCLERHFPAVVAAARVEGATPCEVAVQLLEQQTAARVVLATGPLGRC